MTAYSCDSCGRISTTTLDKERCHYCGGTTHVLSEDAVEIPIPKSWFGTDFVAVVYRGRVVDLLLASGRSSVHGYLSHELVRVQEYVDHLGPADEAHRTTDIEVKHGNNAYVVRLEDGVPRILIPAISTEVELGDSYLTASEREQILTLALSSNSSSSERKRIIEIALDQKREGETRRSTTGTQRKTIQGRGGIGRFPVLSAGLRHKLEQFFRALRHIIEVVLGQTRQAIRGNGGSGDVRAPKVGLPPKREECRRASEVPPPTRENRATSRAGKNDGEEPTVASQAGKAVGEHPAAGRILVVDDEETVREIIISMLAAADFKCRGAASGMEALTVLESGEEFDLVLDDLMMGDMDGVALLERIKDKYPDMPVVIVTAVHNIQVALQALRNGAYDYLLKPFEREQLLATVRRALENRRLKRENDTYRTNLEALVATRAQQWKTALSDLENAYDVTLEGFGDALALRDAETEAHSRRVTAYVIAMARTMTLPKEEIIVIARAAFLHDVGKLAIPDSILCKPGALTPDETAIMRQYVCRGYETIKRIPFLAAAAEIIYCHQERHDGRGYPRGLKGEEIPLGARLVAVANTLDSNTSDLPYRAAQSFGAARAEIERWSGRQFDPEIVRMFLTMPDTIWGDLRRDIDG